ncbi:MAG TPA: hypothetical protein VII06_34790 [Chloroflexota bacterium]|jgi:hypothetical protein
MPAGGDDHLKTDVNQPTIAELQNEESIARTTREIVSMLRKQ